MELNWLESVAYGFISGLFDIIPVSAQAHKVLILKCLGIKDAMPLLNLFIDLAVLGALYFSCRGILVRMNRARALARVPKKNADGLWM